MKKKDWITLIMSTVGGILLAMGMCMALLPEWDAMAPGVVMGAVGAVILIAMVMVRRRMDGKPAMAFRGRVIGIALFGVLGALVLGAGMCMTMVWEMLLPGIVVGIVGIVLLLCLIPMIKGLK